MESSDIFRDFLSRQQLFVTQERLEIARIAANFKERMFTVEDIYSAINRKRFMMAKSTVYRNIKLLRSAGLIEAVSMLEGNKKLFRNIIPQEVTCRICCLDCEFEESFKDKRLETLIFEICEKYNVEKFGVLVRIESRKCYSHSHREKLSCASTERKN